MFYERLPQSLKYGDDEFPLVVEGGDLTIDQHTFSTTPVKVPGASLPGITFSGYEKALAEGEYILGLSFEKSEYDDTAFQQDTLASDITTLKVQGFWVDISFRLENLLDGTGSWKPGYPGAELKFSLGNGTFSSVRLETSGIVRLEGVQVDNPELGFPVPEGGFTLSFPESNTEVTSLRLTGEFPSHKKSVQSSYFLQPVGRETAGTRFENVVNLYLLKFNTSRGFTLTRDLRVFGEESQINLTKSLTAFFDERLEELYELADDYVSLYLDPYTAYTNEYL